MSSFPRLDILPPAQRQLWPQLRTVRSEGFVLYGGTAVALYLGHRESVDFDFFTGRGFRPEDLLKKFQFLEGAEFLQSQPNTVTVLTRSSSGLQQVKLSFFGGLDFGRLADSQPTPDGALELASLKDLLAHKLKVLLQRVEAKDYLDIDAMLSNGMDLAGGLAGARALFPAFTPQECLKALTYFNDAGVASLPVALQKRLIKAVEGVQSIPQAAVISKKLSVAGAV